MGKTAVASFMAEWGLVQDGGMGLKGESRFVLAPGTPYA